MKNKVLHDLNFKELLDYPAEFQPQSYFNPPIKCTGFCTDCESNGVMEKAGGKLTLMSHGCDASDIETILGTSPARTKHVAAPAMFLLEDPGGDYDFRTPIEHKGITKKVPDGIYYFSPNCKTWPSSFAEVMESENYYGNYFAYLMQRHGLDDVYITNIVKCKAEQNKGLVVNNCVSKYLDREVAAFKPQLIFCFVKYWTGFIKNRYPQVPVVWLFHPAYIQSGCRRHGRTAQWTAAENDRRIEAELIGRNLTTRTE